MNLLPLNGVSSLRRTIPQEHEDLEMSWNQVKRTAQNWVRWKVAFEASCSGRSEEDKTKLSINADFALNLAPIYKLSN